jgi:purine-binding chemotaxis protein CheW
MADNQEKIILETDDGEFSEGARAKSKPIRVLVFSLGKESYCIEIKQAKEVINLSEATRVPNVPEFVSGVINLRGEIMALIDPYYFLGVEKKEKAQEAKVIVTDAAGYTVGFLVDKIEEALDIEESSIQPPLVTLNDKLAGYTKGNIQMGDRILIFLDLASVLSSEEISNLRRGKE